MLWRPLTAVMLLAAVPVAASTPVVYVGQGSAAVTAEHAFPPFTLCERADLQVTVYQQDGQWRPALVRAYYDAAGLPCNGGWEIPLTLSAAQRMMGEHIVVGSPETGFYVEVVDDSPCSISSYTIGPLGPSTTYSARDTECPGSSLPDSFEEGTLSFVGLG